MGVPIDRGLTQLPAVLEGQGRLHVEMGVPIDRGLTLTVRAFVEGIDTEYNHSNC